MGPSLALSHLMVTRVVTNSIYPLMGCWHRLVYSVLCNRMDGDWYVMRAQQHQKGIVDSHCVPCRPGQVISA